VYTSEEVDAKARTHIKVYTIEDTARGGGRGNAGFADCPFHITASTHSFPGVMHTCSVRTRAASSNPARMTTLVFVLDVDERAAESPSVEAPCRGDNLHSHSPPNSIENKVGGLSPLGVGSRATSRLRGATPCHSPLLPLTCPEHCFRPRGGSSSPLTARAHPQIPNDNFLVEAT